jgi:hypothetical protein
MSLPFTVEQFLEVFARYNEAIWPAQLGAYLLGGATFAVAIRGGRVAARVVPALLAAAWFFVGVAYHWAFFAGVNPVARAFAAAFVLEAGLLVQAALRERLEFPGRTLAGARLLLGGAVVAYAAVGYPLLGAALGHVYPRAPTFGVTPCPTTIFTFGVFLLTGGRFPLRLLVVPLAWAAVGASAALELGMREDLGLPVAAAIAAGVLARPAVSGGRGRRAPTAARTPRRTSRSAARS